MKHVCSKSAEAMVRRMRPNSLIVVVALLIALAVPVQVEAEQRTITVTGHGEASAKPDTVSVNFVIEQRAPDAGQATTLLNQAVSKLTGTLKGQIGGGTVKASEYSINPSYPFYNPMPLPTPAPFQQNPATWTYQAEVTAYADRIQTIGELIEAGLAAGASRVAYSGFMNTGWGGSNAASWPLVRGVPGRFSGRTNVNGPRPTAPSVTLEIDITGTSPRQCADEGARVTEQVEQALKAKLGKNGGVEVAQFSINNTRPQPPGYAPPVLQRQPQPGGYIARATLTVTSDLPGNVGNLIAAGMAGGASRLASVSFSLRNNTVARTAAVRQAADEARAKAQTVAVSMGVKLKEVIRIDTNAQALPRVFPGGYFVASARSLYRMSREATLVPTPGIASTVVGPTITPGDITFVADVTVVYEID
jgi:uncharacterized protein YggE